MKPLDGIVVLDFSHWIAGPYTGQFLADMGADVIKVEPPQGAEERRMENADRYNMNSRMFLALNRGKKSICVDLKSEEGREIVNKLVKKADIVVQNYAPGVAKKLGIDYDTFSKINEKIIFVSSTAFGESGPYQKRKGFDIIAHAASGIMSVYADEMGNPRGPGGTAYIDIGTAMLNAMSAVAALYHRTQTGEGQKIETCLFNTGIALQANGFLEIDRLDSEMHGKMKEVLKTARDNDMKHNDIIDAFSRMSLRYEQPHSTRDIEIVECNHRPSDRQTFPYYRVYQVKDGFISIGALTVKQRLSMCEVLDIEDKFAHIDIGNGNDETYFYQKEVMKKIEEKLGEKTKDQWIEILEKAGVPCGPVNYAIDLFDNPHALHNNMVWDLENKAVGPYKMMGNPIKFTKTPITPTKGAPVLGEDTVEVLQFLGYDDDAIEKLQKDEIVKSYTE